MSKKQYIIKRTAQTFLLLFLILTFLFIFFRLMPGNVTALMTNAGASPEAIAAVEEKWGLNDPIHVQYLNFMQNLLQGDMGTSLQYKEPVVGFVKQRIFNTFILVAPGITLAYIVGTFIGTLMGSNRGSRLEKYGIIPLILSGSFPSFFIAIGLMIVFASWLGIFPTSGMLSPGFGNEMSTWWRPYFSGNFALHYVLPVSAVVLRYLFNPALIMRTSVVQVMGEDFTEYHRLTGLPKIKRLRHIAKHSFLPVLTLYPVSMTRALGGLVLIETVFNWPGIGFTLVEAVLARDFPVVQFCFFVVAVWVVLANYVVDIIYGLVDPRISVAE
jgi:peptide/nickel transport system permease protein